MLRTFGLSARRQWLRPLLPFHGHIQEPADIDGQCRCQPVQNIDRWVELLLFDAADVGAIDVRIDGQTLLTQRLFRAQPTKIPRDASTTVHGPHATNLSPVKPSNIFDINGFSSLLLSFMEARMTRAWCQRILGLAMLLLAATGQTYGQRLPQSPWMNGPDQSAHSACMIEKRATDTTGLYIYADYQGFLEFSVYNKAWEESGFTEVDLSVTIDEKRFDVSSTFREQPPRAVIPIPSLDASLRQSRSLRIQGADLLIAIDLDDIGQAIDAVTGCVTRTYGFVEVEEDPPTDNLSDRLGQAVDSSQLQESILATFQCRIDTRNLLGFVSPQSGPPTMETFALTETGNARINGRTLAPVRVESGEHGIELAIFDVRQVIGAYSAVSSSAPPLVNMTDDEMAAYGALNSISSAIIDQMLNGRQRFMAINLAASEVSFFDLTADNAVTNANAASCQRL